LAEGLELTRAQHARIALARWSGVAGLAAPLVLTALVYRGILHTYFWADDFMCMLKIVDWGFFRFVFEPFAGHVPLLRNVVFDVTYQLFGLHASAFFAIVLLTHLANTWLVFRLVRTLTASVLLAAFGATLWGASPLDAGALGWYAVYGQVLLTTIVLAVLDRIARWRDDGPLPSRAMVAGWCGLMLAGVTCFGIGLAEAAVFPLVLFLLLPAAFRDPALRRGLLAFPVLVGASYVGLQRFYAACFTPPDAHEMFTRQSLFAGHPETISAMFWHLTLYGVSTTLVGFLHPLTYPSALACAAVATYFAVLVAGATAADARGRRRLLALGLLALAAYASVAVGRAQLALMFGMAPVRSAQQGRYHYLAPALASCALCVALAHLRRWRSMRLLGAACLAAWLAGSISGYARSPWRIDARPAARQYVESALATINSVVDRSPSGSEVDLPNVPASSPSVMGIRLDPHTFPGWAGVYAIAVPANVLRGRRVRFVERDRALVASFRTGGSRRMAELLITPGEARNRPVGASPP